MDAHSVVLITGAGAGIGAAAARSISRLGYRLMLVDVDGRRVAAVADELSGTVETASSEADVTNPSDVTHVVAETLRRYGRLDALVNIVGGSSGKGLRAVHSLEALEPDEWDRTFALNVTSTYLCCRAAISHIRAAGGGRIVNTASVAGRLYSQVSGPQYSAAKAAVIGLTRHLAFQLAPDNITVNAVAPGVILSERIAQSWHARSDDERDAVLDRVPLARLGEPREPAAAYAFLLGPDAGYITGATIDVNGGLFMG